MNINELLGWATSIIHSFSLDEAIRAAFIILLAAIVLYRFLDARR